ncbi:anhydro-N-acetylmuramic acid kinase [Streptomyces sp. NBC_00344]|uniref:anhydro-N-acetylmuramic acid kinase n=1 Tax=Streptomyces sp. NBC_00344 TaxID=2975720 RepID=UPI002E21BC3B
MRVLGMISGTSHDAMDTAVVDLRDQDGVLEGRVLHTGAVPYETGLRTRIVRALPPHEAGVAEVCRLDTLIGQAFADAAAAAVASAGPVDLVCTHGQTFFHWVEGRRARGTLQLGQPAWIAERLGVPVVADLRSRDIAAGGQGAPLVSHLDTLLMAGMSDRPGALNLGGIANLTTSGPDPVAFDTGPANALLDAAVEEATGQRFDKDGRLAAGGRVVPDLLTDLMDEPYYGFAAPKSTGKELFNGEYLRRMLSHHAGLELNDLLATLAALTAATIADEVHRHKLGRLLVSGGGVRNPVLMAALGRALPAVPVTTTDSLGLPSDAKEAIAFAVIGWHTAHGLPATIPSCTGATAARVLGTIVPGWGPLSLPERAGGAAPRAVRFLAE